MKILSRYLLREHLGPFAFASLALTGLLILNQVALRLANLIGKGLSWDVIGSVFGLSLPFIIAMTIPMAVLVAVLHSFSRLAADSEITALRASGVNLVTLVRTVLIAATLIAGFEFVFVDQVLPRSNHQLKNLLMDIARKKPTFELAEQSVNEVAPGKLFLRAGRIDQAADRMRDVVIYDLANPTRRRTIYADSGYIRFSASQTDLFLTLFDGYIHDYDRSKAETFRRIFFKTDLVRVAGVTNQLERTGENAFRGDREMGLCEMETRVARNLQTAAEAAIDRRRAAEQDALALVGVVAPEPDTTRPPTRNTPTAWYCAAIGLVAGAAAAARPAPPVNRVDADPASRGAPPGGAATPGTAGGAATSTSADTVTRRRAATLAQIQRAYVAPDPEGTALTTRLLSLGNQRNAALGDAASFQVEIHKKYSLAVACIVFVLVGVPVALRFPRGGIGLVIGASVVIFGIYYIGLIGGEALADRRRVSPLLAMWAPNMIMAVVGLVMFRRINREQATVRGATFRFPWGRRRRRRAA